MGALWGRCGATGHASRCRRNPRLAAVRGPGETYSDVILRLVEVEAAS